LGENLFYFGFFDRLLGRVRDQLTTVTQPHTRKSFFGRIGALLGAAVVAPKLFAKSAGKAVAHPNQGNRFQLKPDGRAVARDADSQ
jgi:hypothetical protein